MVEEVFWEQLRRHTRRQVLVMVVHALWIAAVLSVGVLAWDVIADRQERRMIAQLQSSDAESRRQGAWCATSEGIVRAIHLVARQLPAERDPSVRESYVHALGRSGRQEDFDLIAAVVRDDPDARVRQAAWIATARLDERRFRQLTQAVAVRSDAWDRIGIAYAWLETWDVRGVDDLLHWAVEGTPDQRLAAAQALYRHVAPLLEAAGRWPIGGTVREGQEWPAELVAETGRRCAEVNLQAIADDTRPHVARAALVRRNMGKVTHARERLAWLLSRT